MSIPGSAARPPAPAESGVPARIQLRITRYWDLHAADYDPHPLSQVHEGPGHGVWSEVWGRALPAAPAEVLDVGTGTGQVAVVLAGLGHRVVGTDLSEGMLSFARAKAAERALALPPRFELGDAVAPAFPDASFDAVTSRYLLWTLREPLVALGAWRRLLRPGGRLAIVDSPWHPDGLGEGQGQASDDDDFLREYDAEVVGALPLAAARTIDDTAELVRAAGYQDVSVTPLHEVERLERELLEDPDEHGVQLQYLITADAP